MYEINKLSKSFGSNQVLRNINARFTTGRIIAILGPSGCGKTTLLRILAGLDTEYSGDIKGFDQRNSFVFQQSRLLPWKSVLENIKIVLEEINPKRVEERAKKALEMVELGGIENSYPSQLSGGMQQRVSIARAFAYPSKLMFLDEPFQSLDFDLKQRLMKLLLPLWTGENYTVFIVTHDVHVAAVLGDTIAIMGASEGNFIQTLQNPVRRGDRLRGLSEEIITLENSIYQLITQ